jgi:sulfopyruvate decarboxylase subunit beta
MYAAIAGLWVRAAWVYRTSFITLVVANGLITGLDAVAIWIMFSQLDLLGGFALHEVALLYGASSLGLGIALTRPDRQVVVLDGDGSVLMNLGGLTTLARYRPRNLVHVVFDNESLLSVGGFPTATSTGSDIAAMAAAAGVPRTTTVTTLAAFEEAFTEARAARDLTAIVAKVDAVGPAKFVTDLGLLENRFAFARALREATP